MNLHKSKTAAYDLTNEFKTSPLSSTHDILCIQEPWQDFHGNVKVGSEWQICYPTSKPRLSFTTPTRLVIMVNKSLGSDTWEQLDLPGTNDVTVLLVNSEHGVLAIVNVYNDCDHDDSLTSLSTHLRKLLED
ncbi:hypothetical protein L218DRAFT_884352 [Marasmius fiardii PR-910]|nr:hypothetical protein L218DRAFT_884352 [Marasmius fiardii PR-910]